MLTLQLPSASSKLKQLLNHTWIFDRSEAKDEDRKRTELYRAERQRRQHEATSGDFRAFLAGLNLEVDIEVASAKDFPRIAQLTQRTNQFNFTTIRRSERDVAALAESSACECRVVRVRDRFGDYGLVGLIIFAQEDDGLAVESFMLSCRVLGRGVEHRMMASLGELADERSLASVTVPLTETSSNHPAKLFLEQLVISAAGKLGRDHKWWFAAEQLRQVRYDPQSAQLNQSEAKWPASVTAGTDVYSPVANASSLWRRIAIELSDLQVLATRVRRGRSLKAEVSGDPRSRPAAPHGAGEVPYAQLVEELKALFAKTLDLELDAVDAEAALETYVTESLDNVSLTVELKKRFPDIPITILFEHRSLRSLAAYLMKEHTDAVPSSSEESMAVAAAAASGKRVSESKPSVRSEQTSLTGLGAIHRTAKTGDIAIIGINGKYPQAPTISEFWENLLAGKSCISEIPEDRWEVDAFFDGEPAANRSYCKRGGFIDDVGRFDAGFFHISPREAELMDPQQRLFLEVVWGLLEDAGYTRETIGRETGVFVGCNANDYGLYANTLALQGIGAYRNADYFQIPNRVSYFFDFRGPSLCIDTACSSSGTAVYLACQSLRNTQCRAAIAGGINLFLHPSRFIQYSQMQMLSPTGQCSPFGAHADGTVFGEGVGALLLKPLANAERDGDHIYAVIKGCAINSGGKTNGFTVPNPQAHAAVVSQALWEAEVDPATITYVEAHGTGTPLGDPIEIRGLTMAFEQNYGAFEQDYGASEQNYARENAGTQFCAIGSLKANIGHLEAGAAIAGIIKIAMQMNQGILAPSLNARNPNPSIPFTTSPFRVQQEVERWTRLTREADGHTTTYPRRAGLSSFGAGGSNAHVILEEYIADAAPEPGKPHPALILLSARKRETLKTYASRLAAFLRRSSSQADGGRAARLSDIAFTLRVGREQLDERLALVVSSVDELIDKLAGWAASSEEGLAGTGSILEKVYWGNAKTAKHSELPLDGPQWKAFVATLVEKQSLVELAKLWAHGVGIDWPFLPTVDDQGSGLAPFPRRISLPSYPFAGDRFWLPGEPNFKLAQVRDGLASGFHPLLDGIDAALSCGPGIVFYKRLAAQKPIVRDHVVRSQALLPGVGFLEMVCAALKRMGIDAPYRLGEVVWSHPLVIEDQPKEILVSIKAQETGELSYEIGSRESSRE